MTNPVLLSLLAALCYGLSAPAAKLGFNRGMHADGFLLPYGAGLLIFSCISMSKYGGITTLYPNWQTLMYGLLAGGMCAVGFKMSGTALAAPGVSVSVLQVLIATYPLASIAVSVPLFREYETVTMWKLTLGTVLVLAGAALVSTANTNNTH